MHLKRSMPVLGDLAVVVFVVLFGWPVVFRQRGCIVRRGLR
jgi:hypothetical protein